MWTSISQTSLVCQNEVFLALVVQAVARNARGPASVIIKLGNKLGQNKNKLLNNSI